jgi:catechol 2,3-dioxygenase-like lactoylglutathione lyase family enzyme
MRRLGLITVMVPEYDEAIAFYRDVMGFALIEDTAQSPDKRWVVMSPGAGGADLLLAKAADTAQATRIGDQTGGRVFLFLQTQDFDADHRRLAAAGLDFLEAPRREAYGSVAKFRDAFGNLWDLIEAR